MKIAKDDVAAVRAILLHDWDPIGFRVPDDEYDSYLWPVLRMLQEGAPREAIEDYLRTTASDTIGCPVPEARLSLVVDKLLTLGLAR